MEHENWIIVIATLAGPVLAVQAYRTLLGQIDRRTSRITGTKPGQ